MQNSRTSFGQMAMRGALAIASLVALVAPGTASAQATGGMVHGHANSPIGQPITAGQVRLTTDRTAGSSAKKWDYTFNLDTSGNYKGEDIKPATYVAVLFQGGQSVDFVDKVVFSTGEDKQLNFDMTRKEYIDKMTPEQRDDMEKMKKQNADAMAANSKIANLNTLLLQARADIKSGSYDAATKAMTDATTAKPDEPILWEVLGDAQLGQADALVKAAKVSHATDASVPDKYKAAASSYQKALDLNGASSKPNQEMTATSENQLGQAMGKIGKTKEASAAYEAAAKADPKKAAMYYFNEAATLFNANDPDDAASAADRAIAADPTKADAYYIKGQALISKAGVDAKTNKITTPPGCVEAYQKYIELAPTGPYANDVKGILAGIGEPIKSSFKAPGKK